MVIPLFLIPAAVFFTFFYNLWAIVVSLVVCSYFALREKNIPDEAFYFIPVIFAGIFVSVLSKAQFDSFTFILQMMLYAVFFIIGLKISFSKNKSMLLVPLSGFLFLPFLSCSFFNYNPNIVSSYIALLILLLWMSGVQKSFKYALSFLGLYFIVVNGSYIALFSVFSGWIFTEKKKFLPFLILFSAAAVIFNLHSASERILWFYEAAKILFFKPFGAGFFSAKYYLAGKSFPATLFLHSFFAQYVAEGGLLCIIAAVIFLAHFWERIRRGPYAYAALSVLVLGALDLSYYYPAQGMTASLILGISAGASVDGKRVMTGIKLKLWRLLFACCLILSLVMFYNSRNFAVGNYFLFRGNPEKALQSYDKTFRFPKEPALSSARAAALSFIYDKNRKSEILEKSFALQNEAIIVKRADSPAFSDYLASRRTGDTGKLRNSCRRVLYINGIELVKSEEKTPSQSPPWKGGEDSEE